MIGVNNKSGFSDYQVLFCQKTTTLLAISNLDFWKIETIIIEIDYYVLKRTSNFGLLIFCQQTSNIKSTIFSFLLRNYDFTCLKKDFKGKMRLDRVFHFIIY